MENIHFFMEKLTRRTFIRNFLLGTGAIALSQYQIFASDSIFSNSNVRPFEILAIGDSVMWGQGLLFKDKFSFRIKNWLETEIFKNKRAVNLFVAAHSGATIKLKREKGFEPTTTYIGEINISTPSITQQADDAFGWYKNGTIPKGYKEPYPKELGKRLPESLDYYNDAPVAPKNVDLILVNGGINDMGAQNLVNPAFSRDKIIDAAKKYCGSAMEDLLKKLCVQFSNARIVVTGYFPLISKGTSPTAVSEAILNIFDENKLTKFLAKTGRKFSLPEVEKIHPFRNYLAKHSSVWVDESNKNLRHAVNNINNLYPLKGMSGELGKRVFFAESQFEEKNAYGAKESYLWELIDQTKTNDCLYETRTKVCRAQGLDGLIKTDRIICQRAGLFHPNIKGADSYFQSIKTELVKFIQSEV